MPYGRYYPCCRKNFRNEVTKAWGHDGLQNEHVIHAGPNMVVHLSLLFNALLRH